MTNKAKIILHISR